MLKKCCASYIYIYIYIYQNKLRLNIWTMQTVTNLLTSQMQTVTPESWQKRWLYSGQKEVFAHPQKASGAESCRLWISFRPCPMHLYRSGWCGRAIRKREKGFGQSVSLVFGQSISLVSFETAKKTFTLGLRTKEAEERATLVNLKPANGFLCAHNHYFMYLLLQLR